MSPKEVSVLDMMEVRDRRAELQRRMTAAFHVPVISFTMNIAGPVKRTPLIRRGFVLGLRTLRRRLKAAGFPVLHEELLDEFTGCEAFLAVDAGLLAIKALTSDIENSGPLGRLFDMDVISPAGEKAEREMLGLSGRTCLLCGRPAKECARSRTHTVAELQDRTFTILTEAAAEADAEQIAGAACRALLFEVCTTPKPGLVDRENSGSHRDMDIFTYMSSASALYPYFRKCAETGIRTAELPPEAAFVQLRAPGRDAEGVMLEATGGVNTHKGAIFSVGLVSAALGRLAPEERKDPAAVLSVCAAMTKGLTERAFSGLTPEKARTAGQRFYLQYGIRGVRGQAEDGFPAILEAGLPVLEQGLAEGLSLNDAGCAALLHILSAEADTNMIARSSLETAEEIRGAIRELLQETPFPDRNTLEALDLRFRELNLSPGGSADLLAICYLLHFMKTETLV